MQAQPLTHALPTLGSPWLVLCSPGPCRAGVWVHPTDGKETAGHHMMPAGRCMEPGTRPRLAGAGRWEQTELAGTRDTKPPWGLVPATVPRVWFSPDL